MPKRRKNRVVYEGNILQFKVSRRVQGAVSSARERMLMVRRATEVRLESDVAT
jgi:hypothetical protein